MNIVKEELDNLNALLKLTVEEKDYIEKVDTVLKDYRKKMNMPGFRPGMVPMGVVKKMYGVAVKADEINKILNDTVYKYIEENKIDILGNPLPKDDKLGKEDFEHKKDFEFSYELGLSPQFTIGISDKHKFTHYTIKIDDALIEKNIKDLRRRYGMVKPSEVVSEQDMLVVNITEKNKENGIQKKTTIYMEFIEDNKEKSKLLGLKAGDKVVVNPKKLSKDESDVAIMLGVNIDQLKSVKDEADLEIISVHNMELAEENQELFDKIFGPGKVNSKEEFIQKMKEELVEVMTDFSNKKLKKDVVEYFIDKLKIQLPDGFLKKWLKTVQEDKENQQKNMTEEEYEKFSKDMKWMLVENKIVKENELNVSYEELSAHVEELLKKQFEFYGIPMVEGETLKKYVNNVLSNEQELRKISGELIDKKLYSLFKEKLSLKEKEMSYDEFIKVLNEKPKVNLFSKLFNI